MHSVLARLLAASVLVALCSITATAWLVAQSTSTSIRQELGNAVESDAATYRELITFAVRHRDWNGVTLPSGTRRLILTTADREVIADTGADLDPSQLPATPSAVINPLELDLAQAQDAPQDRIDARIAGPFALTPQEKEGLDADAELYTARCESAAQAAETTPPRTTAWGRPILNVDRTAARPASPVCTEVGTRLSTLTPGESAAFNELGLLVNECLQQRGLPAEKITMDASWRPVSSNAECTASARRTQLRPYVAPPALLFVTDAAGKTTQATVLRFDVGRIVLVAAVVLILTVGVSVLVGLRMTRPLRTLTAAAEQLRHGDDAQVDIRSRSEIGQLARAFNDMAAHRARTDAQRKAMTSDISHELRNPLGTIRSWLEGARDGVVDLDRPTLTALLDEALVLQRLIDDLQDLAQAEAGELRLHPEPVDLRDLFEQLAAAHPGLVVEGGGVVIADPVRLRQVLTNLVTNAFRYTPSDGTVRIVSAGGRIEVVDTGSGISAEDLPHVFDRFWRADRSRTRDTGGSGLGLAIAQAIVSAHHGTITVQSELGRGTTFTITLPAR
ncbi:HAMP domain-containing sensor histidine kinase [Lentzea sp. NBRC 102530]|uniref:sensor histidine kinase n=1 Tax=Lentzea sp. NBRC 102530 TaxID=3032201 RepID=UPI0024A1BFB3|nr:HAMP domain-containing sensor histidine kinase [Lentzea sp. NBRC 102530]GLY46875.1 two-component sensor histidine kinase [Lentzea sp. NBRC 102530]